MRGRLTRRASVALLGAIALLALFSGEEDRSTSETSFGRVPDGFGAAYELLAEIGLPVERTYAAPARLAHGSTVWWIAPRDLCESPAEAADADAKATELRRASARKIDPPCLDPTTWLAAGGTGVVFLDGAAASDGRAVGGITVPERAAGEDEPAAAQTIEGALAAEPHRLEAPPLATFADLDPSWTVTAALDGEPFVVERALGAGRLVLVADAAFLTNAWLDRGDAAPLVVDLVRRFGVPRIDERAHGLGPPRNPVRFLARSPALPFFAGALLLALAFAWSAAAVPSRELAESADPRPTLAAFVDSMADLCARTRDHGRVLACYREATAARLRRRFGLPAETSVETLVERLRRRGRADREALELLAVGRPDVGAGALRKAFAALDGLGD